MTNIRVHHEKNYTCIHNDAIRDKRLSWKARGIHHFLLSQPDNWIVNTEHLVKQSGEGRTAVLAALKELEENGYLTRKQTKNESGRFSGWESVLTELPTESRKPDYGEEAAVRLSDSGLSDSGKPDCIINTNRVLNTDFKEVSIPPLPPEQKKEERIKEVEDLDPIPAVSVEQTKLEQPCPGEQDISGLGQFSAAKTATENYRYKRNQPNFPKNIDGSDHLPWDTDKQGKFDPAFQKHMEKSLITTSYYQRLMPGDLTTKVRKHISTGRYDMEARDKLLIEWEAMKEHESRACLTAERRPYTPTPNQRLWEKSFSQLTDADHRNLLEQLVSLGEAVFFDQNRFGESYLRQVLRQKKDLYQEIVGNVCTSA